MQRFGHVNTLDEQQVSNAMTSRRFFYKHAFYLSLCYTESSQANHTCGITIHIDNKKPAIFAIVHRRQGSHFMIEVLKGKVEVKPFDIFEDQRPRIREMLFGRRGNKFN